jgi:hypothetical protein
MNRSKKIALTLSALSLFGLGCVAQAQPSDSRGPGQGGGHHKPPQEAFDACKSSQQGAACSVDFHGHTMTGTCEAFGDEGLACRPDHPPGPPPQAVDACAKAKEGDECTMSFGDKQVDGTCVKMQDTLACHPDHSPGPPPNE